MTGLKSFYYADNDSDLVFEFYDGKNHDGGEQSEQHAAKVDLGLLPPSERTLNLDVFGGLGLLKMLDCSFLQTDDHFK